MSNREGGVKKLMEFRWGGEKNSGTANGRDNKNHTTVFP